MPSYSPLKYLLVCAPLLLAACDDGSGEWTMTRVTNMVPYGNTRTAGSGVAYVRAKMLPERNMNLSAPAESKAVAPAQTSPDKVKSAEPVFEKKQQK